jgi:glycosyltransferase involved in cell wall biosynthesis
MRNYQLMREVAARFEVTLLSYTTPEDDPGLAELRTGLSIQTVLRKQTTQLGRRLSQLRSLTTTQPFANRMLHSDAMQAAINDLCTAADFDLIHVESNAMCNFAFPDGVPIVLDEHNVEYELHRRLYQGERSRLRRWFSFLEYVRVRRFEERCWAQVHGCVVTSAREEPTVQATAPSTPTAVVPNGVDLEYFAPWAGNVQPKSVVFNGILNYRPNLDAAVHLVDDVWPLVLKRCPSARLVLVGSAPKRLVQRLAQPTVEVLGRVPDIRPYLGSAHVIAVPVRMGGGTRLKVVEALSMAKPMVSTSLGCEGLAVRDREHLLIADDAEGFAGRILELFEDAALGQRLGMAGRALAENAYSWHLAGDRLAELYQRVVNGQPDLHRPFARTEPIYALPARA